jgi:hypothetical protein
LAQLIAVRQVARLRNMCGCALKPLGREYEWRLRLLFALEPPQGAQFVA